MKKILVLTDFSENAVHAAKTAAFFAINLRTNILLYNHYQSIPVTPMYVGGAFLAQEAEWMVDESHKGLEEQKQALETFIAQIAGNERQPVIYTQGGEGDLGRHIRYIVHQNNVELIVMGARRFNNGLDHFFFGDQISPVIKNPACPVLVVPPKVDLKKLTSIVFATDYDEGDKEAVRCLVKIARLFACELQIIHIIIFGHDETEKSDKEIDFIEQVATLDYPKIVFQKVRGKDVANRLTHLCKENNTELLAIVNREHSFFMNLIHNNTTQKVLDNQTIPLMIFPSKKS